MTWKTSNAPSEITAAWKSRVYITSSRSGQGEARVVRADDTDGTGSAGPDELNIVTSNAKILFG